MCQRILFHDIRQIETYCDSRRKRQGAEKLAMGFSRIHSTGAPEGRETRIKKSQAGAPPRRGGAVFAHQWAPEKPQAPILLIL